MARYEVEGSAGGMSALAAPPLEVVNLARGALGSKLLVEAEIDVMLDAVRNFHAMEPDEVMRAISAYTARCTELYVQLHRVEGGQREWRQVRTQHVNPLLEELDRQFRIASRLLEVRRQDIESLRGMT